MSNLREQIVKVILEAVNLEHLQLTEEDYDKPLNQAPFNFDSIDFLESVVAIEEEFGTKLGSAEDAAQHFKSFNTILSFVESFK